MPNPRITMPMCIALAATVALFSACAIGENPESTEDSPTMSHPIQEGTSAGRFIALRLHPGDDLRAELVALVKRRDLRAAAIVTCVGSLSQATLRLANAQESRVVPGKLEIVSLTGTLSPDGVHLHMAVADDQGRTFGGHVLAGCSVYTTAEIVIVELPDLAFAREQDPDTGYRELMIRVNANVSTDVDN